MARPSAYKKEPFNELKKKKIKCVYMFMDGDKPIYIGKTKNTKKRFQPYSSRKSHNEKLNLWLQDKNCCFDVIYYEVDNVDDLEVSLINSHKKTLVNISHGNNIDWLIQNRTKKPWVAGRGILSPISNCLRKMKDGEEKKAINNWLNKISDEERCITEIQTFNMTPARNRRWLSLTRLKMIEHLEGCVNER